jgi:hypothetical protein
VRCATLRERRLQARSAWCARLASTAPGTVPTQLIPAGRSASMCGADGVTGRDKKERLSSGTHAGGGLCIC